MNNVINFLTKDLKLEKGDVIVIANSGGPDSMCLFNILLSLRDKYDLKLICAHVNHNVREESKDEKVFLENYSKEHDVVFESMVIEHYGDDNFHNEARKIRYYFFETIVKKYNAKYLMTAHHGDDLIETILMRIVRGSTLKGYSGFEKIIDNGTYKIVRPLVFITKEEAKEYDESNNIPYVTDKSNFKTKYTRNRYRLKVLPFLKEEDKLVHEKFLKFSETLLEYDNFINDEIKRNINKVYIDGDIYLEEFLKLNPLIQKKIIYYVLEDVYKDNLMVINDRHVKLIMSLAESKKANAKICLPRGIDVYKTYEKLDFTNEIKENTNYEVELDRYASLPNKHSIEVVEEEESNNNCVCRIDTSEVALPLYIRTRRLGDKMLLKKTDGYRKIKDIFIDQKVPKKDRDTWPIVVDSKGRVIWIPGIKKSKFTKLKNEKYDIILKYN